MGLLREPLEEAVSKFDAAIALLLLGTIYWDVQTEPDWASFLILGVVLVRCLVLLWEDMKP